MSSPAPNSVSPASLERGSSLIATLASFVPRSPCHSLVAPGVKLLRLVARDAGADFGNSGNKGMVSPATRSEPTLPSGMFLDHSSTRRRGPLCSISSCLMVLLEPIFNGSWKSVGVEPFGGRSVRRVFRILTLVLVLRVLPSCLLLPRSAALGKIPCAFRNSPATVVLVHAGFAGFRQTLSGSCRV